jgi:hypothetical protein
VGASVGGVVLPTPSTRLAALHRRGSDSAPCRHRRAP